MHLFIHFFSFFPFLLSYFLSFLTYVLTFFFLYPFPPPFLLFSSFLLSSATYFLFLFIFLSPSIHSFPPSFFPSLGLSSFPTSSITLFCPSFLILSFFHFSSLLHSIAVSITSLLTYCLSFCHSKCRCKPHFLHLVDDWLVCNRNNFNRNAFAPLK